MPGPAAILREIHRLRRFAKDLQTKIEREPQSLRVQQGRVARQEELLRLAQEGLKRLKVATLEKESSLKATNQQISKYQKQQNEAASKKEYDALQHEIDATKKRVQQLEDEILDAMAQTEDQTPKIPELEKELQQVREETARFERDQGTRRAEFVEQLQQTERQIAEVEATLPAEIHPQYNRLVTAKGEDALASVNGRTCLACYTEITAQNYNDLAQGNFVMCKTCGRMLYLPE
jgi:predicted  nucleic acid-binding Zn-ribbon protein